MVREAVCTVLWLLSQTDAEIGIQNAAGDGMRQRRVRRCIGVLADLQRDPLSQDLRQRIATLAWRRAGQLPDQRSRVRFRGASHRERTGT
ncbi:hypothetical protein CKY51_20880 [Xanthomonas maliensis]|nr:hypothetical protein CKY51_20880 [Xanthomonas maliensis]